MFDLGDGFQLYFTFNYFDIYIVLFVFHLNFNKTKNFAIIINAILGDEYI